MDGHREGFVPSFEQAASIRDAIPSLETQLGEFNAEIARLCALRDQVSTELAVKRSLIAPVRRLPNELLSDIFVHVYHSAPSAKLLEREDKDYASQLIASTVACVCVTWRAVALGTPQLWSNIVIGIGTRHADAYVDACILYSGHHDLDIRCHSDYYLPALLIRVLPHASRLRSIDLTGFIEVYQSQPSHICFPGLRCAAFYVNGHEDIQRIDPFHFLSDAPQLREVNIQMSLQSKARAVRLPMSWKLTHLGFSLGWVCTPLDLLPTVAQYATTLHSFSCNTEKLDTKSMHPIDLPALNRINIERDAHALLKFISAPNLQKIRLTTTRHGDPFASLLAFLSSPKAPVATLRYLKLDKISHNFREQTTRELLHCLERMHDLRGLTISADPDFYERRSSRDMYVPPCFWEGLTVRDGETPILPNLSLFRVFFGGVPLVGEAHELQRRPLRAMLYSRETARVVQGRRVVALERVEVLDEEDISTV